MKKTIIVTGSRGRLATCFIKVLKEQRHEVLAFSRTSGDSYLKLDDLFVSDLLYRCSTIIHTAWSSVPLTSEQLVGIEWENEMPLLFKLLKGTVSRDGTTKTHFIFFSSGGTVYGNAGSKPSSEDDPLRPISWHGFAKIAAEQVIMEFSRRTGLRSTILRISNPYGFPVSSTRPQGIIPYLIEAARNKSVFSIWGDGRAKKDYLHQSDFVSALLKIVQQEPTGVYNLASGISHDVLEIIGIIEEFTGRRIVTQNTPTFAWDVVNSRLDISKLSRDTGWRPKIDLKPGIRLMLGDGCDRSIEWDRRQ
jgi:UDP-glucose 4-epimerase